MANPTEIKHALLLSPRLERFKVKQTRPWKATFRCPFCGDSEKSKTKARGWLYEGRGGALFFQCFNCGKPTNLYGLIAHFDRSAANALLADKFVGDTRRGVAPEPEWKPTEPKFGVEPLRRLKKISQLPVGHPARTYVESRLIPTDTHWRLRYAPKFAKWVNSLVPEKLDASKDSPRLVLPFLSESGDLIGFTGRSFDPGASIRYLTIMLDDRPKIFGLDQVNFELPYFVVEGPIDSLFLPNCIAMAGSSADSRALPNPENATLVWDNEPRNSDVHKMMESALDAGFRIVIWPDGLEHKDINAMVLSGLDPVSIIEDCAYSGLEAKLRLAQWKRRAK